MAKSLTYKQSLFVAYYLGECDGNATKSARLAGYKGNERTLISVGNENLTKPNIKAAIALQTAAMMNKAGITRETILKMYQDTYAKADLLSHSTTMKGCADSMAKMYGLNEERDDKATAPVNIQLNFNGRDQDAP